MQFVPNQVMGYDRAITVFSPDGRILQVEYAKKTVKQGSTAIGMVCKDGVLLVTDKRIVNKLVVTEAVEKIWQIDDNVAWFLRLLHFWEHLGVRNDSYLYVVL